MIMGAGHVTPAAELFWIVVLYGWPGATLGALWLFWDAWWEGGR